MTVIQSSMQYEAEKERKAPMAQKLNREMLSNEQHNWYCKVACMWSLRGTTKRIQNLSWIFSEIFEGCLGLD